MDESLLTMLSQFGAAGLIGVLWILERRHAAARDRQLDESHQRLIAQSHEIEALLGVIKDDTRAISSLESSQQRLVSLLEALSKRAGVKSLQLARRDARS
jgi:hypothetical protein